MLCGIDSEDPSIVELKKEKISIYAQMRKANKKLDEAMLLTELMKTSPRPDQYPALVVDSECPRVLLHR